MTLLDATSTLIDAVKTFAPEEDRKIISAVKRMEKRLEVLRLRHLKEIRRRRHSAWTDCQVVINATCSKCNFKFDFGSFIKQAELTGRGHIKSLYCPACKTHLIGSP